MRQTLTIAKRELMALFCSPIGYVVMGLFSLIISMIFFRFYQPQAPATLRPTLEFVVWALIFLAPAISMRSVSEEYSAGTVELLLTSPINDAQVIMGKWLGAMGFFIALTMFPLMILLFVLVMTSNPEPGPILTQLLGLLLVGGLYLAIGIAASASTQNQIIAFLITVCMIGMVTFGVGLLTTVFDEPWIRRALIYIWINSQFEEFNKGVIDTSSLIYFISGIALFLFIAVKLVESRRWR
jgi:ABC-2 type transport system permease protein